MWYNCIKLYKGISLAEKKTTDNKKIKDKTIRLSPDTWKVLKQYQLDYNIPTMNDVVRLMLSDVGY